VTSFGIIKSHNNHNLDEINRDFDLFDTILLHSKQFKIAHYI